MQGGTLRFNGYLLITYEAPPTWWEGFLSVDGVSLFVCRQSRTCSHCLSWLSRRLYETNQRENLEHLDYRMQ